MTESLKRVWAKYPAWFLMSPVFFSFIPRLLTPNHVPAVLLNEVSNTSVDAWPGAMYIFGFLVALLIGMCIYAFLDKESHRHRFHQLLAGLLIAFGLGLLTWTARDYLNVLLDTSRISVQNAVVASTTTEPVAAKVGYRYPAYLVTQLPESKETVHFQFIHDTRNKAFAQSKYVSFVVGRGYLGRPYVQNISTLN